MSSAPALHEIADGVWAYIQPDGGWMVNNLGLVGGPNGATAVDTTSTHDRMRAYLDAVAGATAQPVRRVVVTHSHPDHCNGLSLLPDAEVIAHRAAAAELRESHVPAPHIFQPYERGAAHARQPTLVFDDALTLDADARPIEVRHPAGAAHTGGDAYVWLPDDGVLFTGDLVFSGGTPFALSGSPAGWLRALEQMTRLEPDVVVPGHGPLGGPELLQPVVDYLRFLIDVAHDAHERGLTALHAARSADLGAFAGLLEPERIAGNLHRALAELEGTEVDFDAAWQDMYEYNGSRPLEVHA
jgi:cyclase